MDEQFLAPLIVFGTIAFCFWCIHYYKNKEKEKVQDTICKAIDAGQQLTVETVKALGVNAISPTFADLRKSVLFIGFGIAFIIFAQVVPDDEAPQILTGVSAFPIILGIGYFIVYRLGLKEHK